MPFNITRNALQLARRCPRSLPTRRTYAQQAPETNSSSQQQSTVSAGRSNRVPLIAALSLAAFVPIFYMLQATIGTGNKAPRSGHAEIKEARRESGTHNETRDPRDSARKTTEADGPKRMS